MRLLIGIILLFFSTCGTAYTQNLIVKPDINKEQNYFSAEVYNKFPCPITLTVKSTALDTSFQTFIPKKQKRILFEWHDPPKALAKNYRELFDYNFVLGDPAVVHDDRYQYELPYPKGEAYKLVQGNKSEHTHNEIMSKYAFDFAMPEGSHVSAARGGVVGHVVERYSKGGNNPDLKDKGNLIMICHDDGTVATYAHLQKDGAIVEIGDMVYAGQIIGFSGSTGYATFPHLHFVVAAGERSVPIYFKNHYSILFEGEIYEHREQ